MDTIAKTTADNDTMNEAKRNSIAWEYKYQLLSFMNEYETMEQYEHQKVALLRRAEYSTELLHILDPRRAVEVMEDFKSENERIKDRINEQNRILKYKANKLMEAAALAPANTSSMKYPSPASKPPPSTAPAKMLLQLRLLSSRVNSPSCGELHKFEARDFPVRA